MSLYRNSDKSNVLLNIKDTVWYTESRNMEERLNKGVYTRMSCSKLRDFPLQVLVRCWNVFWFDYHFSGSFIEIYGLFKSHHQERTFWISSGTTVDLCHREKVIKFEFFAAFWFQNQLFLRPTKQLFLTKCGKYRNIVHIFFFN